MTSLHVICGLGPPIKNPGYAYVVRYGSRCEVRSSQILNVPYRTAVLAWEENKLATFELKSGFAFS